ncbi:MAG: hypothetical protein ACJASH_001832 [Bermanella sp.]|jgi:hypothetical protein
MLNISFKSNLIDSNNSNERLIIILFMGFYAYLAIVDIVVSCRFLGEQVLFKKKIIAVIL